VTRIVPWRTGIGSAPYRPGAATLRALSRIKVTDVSVRSLSIPALGRTYAGTEDS
jgi:hypothetical protein